MAEYKQVAEFVNDVQAELLGESAPAEWSLENIVETGVAIQALDNWQNRLVPALVNRIGRAVYVDRLYSSSMPSLYTDAWEYGSIMAKFSTTLVEATDNPAWDLTPGTSYDMDVFKGMDAKAKFWNKRTTHMVEQSIPDYQLKDSFRDATEMNAFISMIQTHIANSLTLKNEALIAATIANLVGETLSRGQSTQKINLLARYNAEMGLSGSDALTVYNALHTPEFLRFATIEMARWLKRMRKYSTKFNVGKTQKFTPPERLKGIILDDFHTAFGTYLYDASSQFSHEYLGLPDADSIAYWQAPGDYSFAQLSKINVETGTGAAISQTGVVAVFFDRWAAGVTNYNPRVDSHYNAKANFTNYWYKREAGYFNDTDENTIVFYLA